MGLASLFLGLVFPSLTFAGMPAEKVASAEIKDIVLSKAFAAMEGPVKNAPITLQPNGSGLYYITGLKIEILRDGKDSPEFLCHSRMGTVLKSVDYEKLSNIYGNDDLELHNIVALSQGQTELKFPEGFGFRVRVPPRRTLLQGVQLQSLSQGQDAQKVSIKSTLHYLDGPAAEQAGIRQLKLLRLLLDVTDKHHSHGGHARGHFVLKPGLFTHTLDVSNEIRKKLEGPSATIHYIRVHLHAFALAIKLTDKTTGKVVWEGKADTNLKTEALLHTDFYSSTTGFPIYRDHKYEISAIYNNPKPTEGEGMASIVAYFR